MTPPQWPGAATHDPVTTDEHGLTDAAAHNGARTLDSLSTHYVGRPPQPLVWRREDAAPPLPHSRHGRADDGSPVAPDGPAGRSPEERFAARVATIRALKRGRGDAWRQMGEELRQLKLEGYWQTQGEPSFDRWAWRTFRFNRRTVSSLLGIAAEPIGGGVHGRRGRSPRAQARAERAIAREAQIGDVEGSPETAKTSTSPSMSVDGVITPAAAAAARGRLGWTARQLGQIERLGAASWGAGFTDAERAAAGRAFDELIVCLVACKRTLTHGREEKPA